MAPFLTGRLRPYGRRAVSAKSAFAPGAFGFTLDDVQREINLLVGHDYSMPLASRKAGSLKLRDTPDALTFEAALPSNQLGLTILEPGSRARLRSMGPRLVSRSQIFRAPKSRYPSREIPASSSESCVKCCSSR